MTRSEIVEALADILETEAKDIADAAKLDEFEAWDSVAILSVVSLYTDITGKFTHATDVMGKTTVGELIDFLMA